MSYKPCPFCGRKDKLSVQKFPGCQHVKTVYCDGCGAWGAGGSEDDERAIDFWNLRLTSDWSRLWKRAAKDHKFYAAESELSVLRMKAERDAALARCKVLEETADAFKFLFDESGIACEQLRERVERYENVLQNAADYISCSDPFLPNPERGESYRSCRECEQCHLLMDISAALAETAE